MSQVISSSSSKIASPTASPKREEIVFTDKSIKYLQPSIKRRIVWSTGNKGFGVRVTPKGQKTFVYMYKYETRDRMLSLGVYPKMSLAEALQLYAKCKDDIDHGVDPGDQHTADRRDIRNAPTVSELKRDYIEKYAKLNMASWAEDERMLDLDIVPALGSMKTTSVRPAHIVDCIDKIVERNSPVSANRTLGAAKRMFGWAVDRKVLTISPCATIKRPYSESHKDRYLTLDEVGLFWKKIDGVKLSDKVTAALKLLLLTMQRSTEVIAIQKREINLKAATWIIPAERSKNKKPHLVPLSPQALLLIQQAIGEGEDTEESDFLFAGRGENDCMANTALSRAVARKLDLLGIAKFTPHDFRRTGSTQLGAFRVPRFDRERILNHTDDSIGAVYDIYDYEDEKRAALNLWADIISSCAASPGEVDEKALKAKLKYRDYFPD